MPDYVDSVFHGLADPTRRAVIERLSRGSAAVSELRRPFPMALPSFMQHLDVLEQCGLVTSRKLGRVRTYQLVPKRLRIVSTWLDRQRLHWEKRPDQLDSYSLELKGRK